MSKIVPYKGNEPYIFISYAHRDKDTVCEVLANMLTDGYRVWFDAGIDPGTEWDEVIAAHVEACAYFIAFISEGYLASENCKDELNYARDLGKKRLLVYLEDVKLPGGMAMRMNRLQSIFKNRYESDADFYATLYAADGISAFVGKADTPTEQAAPLAASAGLEYFVDDEDEDCNEADLVGIGSCTDADVVVASAFEGLPVTAIGACSFDACTSVRSVYLPDTITVICSLAFRLSAELTEVSLPAALQKICAYAFAGCRSLTKIRYRGSKAQWNKIAKEGGWNQDTGNYTVYCTDGEIEK